MVLDSLVIALHLLTSKSRAKAYLRFDSPTLGVSFYLETLSFA